MGFVGRPHLPRGSVAKSQAHKRVGSGFPNQSEEERTGEGSGKKK
jgi:hypothetical protein